MTSGTASSATARTAARGTALAAALDVLAVLVFASVGRSSHAEGITAAGVLETAGPFLLGAVFGWLVGRIWRAPSRLPAGALVWAATWVVGMAVRVLFTHRLPVSFLLIAGTSLAVLLLGWRVVALAVTRVRRRSA